LKELIDHIPFLDLTIIAIVVAFLIVGWKSGLPRMLMVLGSLYTGFLLASIYYHLFADALSRTFGWRLDFVLDVISFFVVDIMVTSLMLGLLIGLFSHIEVKGRIMVFGKVLGATGGVLAGLVVVLIAVTLLRVPYENHKQDLNANSNASLIELFNQGYDRSGLSPLFVKAAPPMLTTIAPMLPLEARQRGTIPLLWGVTSQR